MPKFASNRSETGSFTDPAELEIAQQKLFLLVQNESSYLERKSLLKSSSISETCTILKLSPFVGLIGLHRAKQCTQLLETATFVTKRPVILDA